MDPKTLDKRLQQRLLRRRAIHADELAKAMAKLPDHAGALRSPAPEDLERLGQELPIEGEIRAERIARAVERHRLRSELEPEEPVVRPAEPEPDTEL